MPGFVDSVESNVRGAVLWWGREDRTARDAVPTIDGPRLPRVRWLAKKISGADYGCRHLKLARYGFDEWARSDVAVSQLFADFKIIIGWMQPGYRWFKAWDLLINPRSRKDEWSNTWLKGYMCVISPLMLLIVSSTQLAMMTETRLGLLTSRGWNVQKATHNAHWIALVGAASAVAESGVSMAFCFTRKQQYLDGGSQKWTEYLVQKERTGKESRDAKALKKSSKALRREAHELGRQGWADVWNGLKFSCDFLRAMAELRLAKKFANRAAFAGAACAVLNSWKETWPHAHTTPEAA